MARLIGRLQPDSRPPRASEAEECGIHRWLLPLHVTATGIEPFAPRLDDLLREQPTCQFAIEWHIHTQLSPQQELKAIQQSLPLLQHSNTLRINGKPTLWIHDTELLSHPYFSAFRLGQAFRTKALIIAAITQKHDGFEAHYERSDRLPVQQLKSGRLNYESFLAHAHYRKHQRDDLLIPCVTATSGDGMRHWSPSHYHEWLEQNRAWISLHRHAPSERFVVVEDWEGHRRLHTSQTKQDRAATPSPSIPGQTRSWGETEAREPALLVHGFHLDILEQQLETIPLGDRERLNLYLSTPSEQLQAIESILIAQQWGRVQLVGCANQGRDIAPFLLELLPRAFNCGHPWLIKLHTKRSPDKPGGDQWGRNLWNALTSPEGFEQLQSIFTNAKEPTLACPAGSLLPASVCLAGNQKHLLEHLHNAGIDSRWWLRQQFIAGSMWAADRSSLKALMELQLELSDFEQETGQTDGTLAHALERLIPALMIHQQSTRVIELSANGPERSQAFGHSWARAQAAG